MEGMVRGGVIDGLVEVLDAHIESVRSRRGDPRDPGPAAVGCVLYLTSDQVVERLSSLGACCIVIDKGSKEAAAKLIEADNSFPNVLPEHRLLAPAENGKPVILGPMDELPWYGLGPLRVAGWRGQERGLASLPNSPCVREGGQRLVRAYGHSHPA